MRPTRQTATPGPAVKPRDRDTASSPGTSGTIRVLFVIDSLGAGGAERSLVEMLPSLRSHGIDPVVACLHARPTTANGELRGEGVPVAVLSGRGIASRIAALRRLILRERPDVVHTMLFESDLVGRLAAVGTGVTVLTSLVNTTYDPVRVGDANVPRVRLKAAQLVDAWSARNLTTHFHAISNAVKAHAVESLGIPPDRVTVVERGRDRRRLGDPSPARRLEARRRLGLNDQQEVVVTVGRQEYQKGHRYLLEAIALLQGRPGLVGLIVGRRGHVSADLEELWHRLDLDGHVQLLGHRDDVPDLLAAADVFVFPSLYEGLGGALIEAMALGLPIVASDLPAIREVVEPGENAVIVPPAAPGAMAAALSTLLGDASMRKKFGRRSRRIFCDRFQLDHSVERMARLYGALAPGPRHGRSSKP